MSEGTYIVGGTVKKAGCYICVPCGYKRWLSAGETFPTCMGCMKTSMPVTEANFAEAELQGIEIDEFAEDAAAPNLEIWELVEKV